MRAIIISAELLDLSPETNAQRTSDLRAMLKRFKLPFRHALGRFKGIDEASFVIPVDPESASVRLRLALELAVLFEQECILDLNDAIGTLRDQAGECIGALTLIEECMRASRPTYDHTAISIAGRYLILRLA